MSESVPLDGAHVWRDHQIALRAPGLLAAALHDLKAAVDHLKDIGWRLIAAHWAPVATPSGPGRQAKFYSLTRKGRQQLDKEVANWKRLSSAIDAVIETA